ncbi:MAG: hypothetical protein R3F62_12445 [Planctomycetota bacterium]
MTLTASVGEATWTWPATLAHVEGEVDPRSRQLAAIARIEAGRPAPGEVRRARRSPGAPYAAVVIPRAVALAGREVLVVDREAGVVAGARSRSRSRAPTKPVVSAGSADGDLLCTTPLVFAGDELAVTVHELPSAQEDPCDRLVRQERRRRQPAHARDRGRRPSPCCAERPILEVFPEFESDVIQVSLSYRGVTPAEIEEGMLVKVEEAIQDLEGSWRSCAPARARARLGLDRGRAAHRPAVLLGRREEPGGRDLDLPQRGRAPGLQPGSWPARGDRARGRGEAVPEDVLVRLGERVRDDLTAIKG